MNERYKFIKITDHVKYCGNYQILDMAGEESPRIFSLEEDAKKKYKELNETNLIEI